MFKSLKAKLLLAVVGMVVFTTITITLFVQVEVEESIFKAQDENAKNLLHATLLSVENQYKSLLFHRQASMEKRKSELRSVLTVALHFIRDEHDRAQRGEITTAEAKARAIRAIGKVRYNDRVGYIWINDTGRPIPRMIMHPTMPRLDGKVLDDPAFNCALGNRTNLFKAFVDVCLDRGRGFVDYLWPKPTRNGLTTEQPKLSYVELFPEWNWVVGTGLYIDDIDRDLEKKRQAILKDLAHSFAQVQVAQSGYMYLFTGDQKMLVHPSLKGADFSKLVNPVTGNRILEDLMLAARTPEGRLDYLWEKPPTHSGDFRFWKRSYVAWCESLDWYIASSVYLDENKLPATNMRGRILLVALAILSLSILLALVIANGLTRPLQRLVTAAGRIEQRGVNRATIPIGGTTETRRLGSVLDRMVTSIGMAVREKEELVRALETSNEEMVRTNRQLQEEVQVRQRTETELLVARDRAEAANRIKSEFIANMSHEIRTPLNAINGFSELLTALVENPKQKSYLESIKTAGESLLILINDILDLSKIEAGKLDITPVPTDPRKVLADIEHIFQLKAAGRGLEFAVEVDPDLPAGLILDEARLRQVLLNLVGNAIKFTDRGSVRIQAEGRHPEGVTDRADLVIAVEDTGMGIAPEEQQAIFQAFIQQEGQDTNRFGGTGLGLTISRKLTLLMGGDIQVVSEPGRGSRFTLHLKDLAVSTPEREGRTREAAAWDRCRFRPATVLIADDIASNRQLLVEFLTGCGLRSLVAHNGEEVLQQVRSNPVDLILMDLHMPVLDGCTTAARLKGEEATASIPILALTAARDEAGEEYRDFFDGHLLKPIRLGTLVDELKGFLPLAEEETIAAPGETADLAAIRDLEGLVAALEAECLAQATELIGVMNMDKVARFAADIVTLGEKHEADLLLAFGRKVEELKESFDIEGLESELAAFPGLVAALREEGED